MLKAIAYGEAISWGNYVQLSVLTSAHIESHRDSTGSDSIPILPSLVDADGMSIHVHPSQFLQRVSYQYSQTMSNHVKPGFSQ